MAKQSAAVMKIPLTQDRVALVDAADFEWLSQWKWSVTRNGQQWYAVRNCYRCGKTQKIYMHRMVATAAPGIETDHINGDGLDNRRTNLRVATRTQNNGNHPGLGGTSPYRGVSWCGALGKWHAQVSRANKNVHLGYFRCEKRAALAYDEGALGYFGGFAWLNQDHFDELREVS